MKDSSFAGPVGRSSAYRSCYKCTDRTETCHVTCERYAVDREAAEKLTRWLHEDSYFAGKNYGFPKEYKH